ncbi:MAG: hypothetical protein RLO17_23615 [Cyclobacteriaceae bacterium]
MIDLINDILSSREVANMIARIQGETLRIAFILSGFLFLVNLAIIYVKVVLSEQSLNWETIKPGVIRMFIILSILAVYNPFMSTVDGAFQSIYNDVGDETVNSRAFRNYVAKREEQNARIESTGLDMEEISETSLPPNALVEESTMGSFITFLHAIEVLILSIIGMIMTILAWAQIQVMRIIGPLALGFSILEIWKGNSLKWFNGYVNGFATMIVILVFSLIQSQMSALILTFPNMDLSAFIVLDIIMIGMYLSAFKLGSYLAGEDVLGRALAPIGSLAMTAATAGASKLLGKKSFNIAKSLKGNK